MAIEVILENHTGNISYRARMDEHVPVRELIPVIISLLSLSSRDSQGQPIIYFLFHHNRRLPEDITLAKAKVKEGDFLDIISDRHPEDSGENPFLKRNQVETNSFDTLPVTLEFPTANRIHQARISSTAPVGQIIPDVITKLKLPLTDTSGQNVSYELYYKDRILQEEETLSTANVQAYETVVLLGRIENEAKGEGLFRGLDDSYHFDFGDTLPESIPAGFQLLHTLRGHKRKICQIAWSPDGRILASVSRDGTIRLWDVDNGVQKSLFRGLTGNITNVTWSPDSEVLAVGCTDYSIWLWNVNTGEHLLTLREDSEGVINIGLSARKKENIHRILRGNVGDVASVAWSPVGDILASTADKAIHIWNTQTGQCLHTLEKHTENVNTLAWSPDGMLLASGSSDTRVMLWDTQTWQLCQQVIVLGSDVNDITWSNDGTMLAISLDNNTVNIWNTKDERLLQTLEGHADMVVCTSMTSDRHFLASQSYDGKILLWRADTWRPVAMFQETPSYGWTTNLAFHPKAPLLATISEQFIHIWALDYDVFDTVLTSPASSISYVNAKVFLVGDTGVGKSSLGLALMGRPFTPVFSTYARQVWTFDTDEILIEDGRTETREIFLWDLAGQPGYRLIHQLHLRDVTVALVVFDARNEVDPFSGVKYWDRALRQAQRARSDSALPMKKFLVAARMDADVPDPGSEVLAQKLKFDACFETSTPEGRNIAELAKAIREAIEWDRLPKVTSMYVFEQIREFLRKWKEAGNPLSIADDLCSAFLNSVSVVSQEDEPFTLFHACIKSMESQDLVRRLSFGNLVLLQPELLDFYASALVNAVKMEQDGLGSIAEERVRIGNFRIPDNERRLKDIKKEQLLLIAMVEDLLQQEIALRESTNDGSFLIFPSQCTLERPTIRESKGKVVIFRFEGSVFNIYATLVVRLSHSGVFQRKDIWKNAVTYETRAGGTYGILLHNLGEGRGEITLFFDEQKSPVPLFYFEEFVRQHLEQRAIEGSVERQPIFVCPYCEITISIETVHERSKLGKNWLICSVCEGCISLGEGGESLTVFLPSLIKEMDDNADSERDREVNASILQGKIATGSFDVFLCYDHEDRLQVMEVGEQLRGLGILPWVDEWELRPGFSWQQVLEEQIGQIKAAAVFVGGNGRGPWQHAEKRSFLRQFVRRKQKCPVIPVILPDCEKAPALPIFLKGMTWVDFRKPDPDPMRQLVWGITGRRI